MVEYEIFIDVDFAGRKEAKTSALGSQEGILGVEERVSKEDLERASANKEEILLMLRDPTTVRSFKARALVSKNPEELPEADTLRLVWTKGILDEKPWAVKVIEQIPFEEEGEEEVTALPRRRLTLAERKGHILIDLLKEREEKTRRKSGG